MDTNQIQELATQWLFVNGPKLGLIIIIAIASHYILSAILGGILRKWMVTKVTGRTRSGRSKRIETMNQVISQTLGIVIFIFTTLTILAEIGINVTPFLTGAGILGIAIGFGAQDMVKNIFHGLFILVEDQFAEGDIITINGLSGTVEAFDLRRTVIRDLNGTQHHIPNGEVTTASNHTKQWARINWNVGVGYDSNLDKVRKVINETGEKLFVMHSEDVLEAPKMEGVEEFGDSAIIVKILGKVEAGQQWAMARVYRELLKTAFDKAKIEIPYPHQVEISKRAKK